MAVGKPPFPQTHCSPQSVVVVAELQLSCLLLCHHVSPHHVGLGRCLQQPRAQQEPDACLELGLGLQHLWGLLLHQEGAEGQRDTVALGTTPHQLCHQPLQTHLNPWPPQPPSPLPPDQAGQHVIEALQEPGQQLRPQLCAHCHHLLLQLEVNLEQVLTPGERGTLSTPSSLTQSPLGQWGEQEVSQGPPALLCAPSPLLQRRQILLKDGPIPCQLLLSLPDLDPLQDLLFGSLQFLHSLQDEVGQFPGGPGALHSPIPPWPLIPERLDLMDSVLQPLQPQVELQLLLPPVEAEGQVVILGQSRAGSAGAEAGLTPRGARDGSREHPPV